MERYVLELKIHGTCNGYPVERLQERKLSEAAVLMSSLLTTDGDDWSVACAPISSARTQHPNQHAFDLSWV